jgi:hypothetical protein
VHSSIFLPTGCYDAGPADGRRIRNAVGKWPPGHRYRYPLAERGWTRERCEAEILDAGLPLPIKSACLMCPASKKSEVDWLHRSHPDLADLSIEMERRAHARGLRTTRGLGRRWSWAEFLGHGDRVVPDQRREEDSEGQDDLPVVVAARKGRAARFAPLPAAPPTGR